MIDFRSDQEKQNAANQVQAEQNDYRQAFLKSQEENAQLHAKLAQISANHTELQNRMGELFQAFETHRQAVHKQTDDMLQMSRSIEEMVTHSYQQNQTLMEQYRTGINQRLSTLRDQAQLEHKP